MNTITIIFTLIVALEAFFIMGLEMFFVTSKIAQRAFELDEDFLKQKRIKVMFANQGLYNGFLGAGIVWSIFFVPSAFRQGTAIFFVSCVLVAAIYGSLTSSKKILIKQGLPALIALILLILL